MITQEQAKQLKVGDKVHSCSESELKCEEWEVITPYADYPEGWFVQLEAPSYGGKCFRGISKMSAERWHFPNECPPPSRNLRVEVYRVWDGKKVGFFYVSMDDDMDFLRRNVPELIHGVAVIADAEI